MAQDGSHLMSIISFVISLDYVCFLIHLQLKFHLWTILTLLNWLDADSIVLRTVTTAFRQFY